MRQPVSLALSALAPLILALPATTLAQFVPPPTISLPTGPVFGMPGQQFLLCASNLGPTPVMATLEILDGRTGAVKSSSRVTLPPLSAPVPNLPPDPCLTFPIVSPPPITGAPPTTTHAVFIGAVSLNPQPLPPQAAVQMVASLQVCGGKVIMSPLSKVEMSP